MVSLYVLAARIFFMKLTRSLFMSIMAVSWTPLN